MTETPTKLGKMPQIGGFLERPKVSVVPMMDWTDDVRKCSWIRYLGPCEKSCSLYVASMEMAQGAEGDRFGPSAGTWPITVVI